MKLLKTGFVANDKWRQAPGFELLRHKCIRKIALFHSLLKLQVQNDKKPFYSSELSVHERSIFPYQKRNWHFWESPKPPNIV